MEAFDGRGLRARAAAWRPTAAWVLVVATAQWLRPCSRGLLLHADGARGELSVRLASLLLSAALAAWLGGWLGRERAGARALGLGRTSAVTMAVLAALAGLAPQASVTRWAVYLGVDGWGALWVALCWERLGAHSAHRGPQMARAGLWALRGGLLGALAAAGLAVTLPSWAVLAAAVPVSLLVARWLGGAVAVDAQAPVDAGRSAASQPPAPAAASGLAAGGALLLVVVAGGEVLAQLVDYRVAQLATERYGGLGALRRFLGLIGALSAAFGLLAQGAWLRFAGGRRRAAAGLLFVPLAVLLVLGASGLLGTSALLSAALLQVLERGLGHSVHQSAREQLLGGLVGDSGAWRPWVSSVAPRLGRLLGVLGSMALAAVAPGLAPLAIGASAAGLAVVTAWLGLRLQRAFHDPGRTAPGGSLAGLLMDSLPLRGEVMASPGER